jgi:photosystem II stability/assembly factor-like uncharacterized protein
VLTDHSDNIPESDRYIAALAAEGSKLVAITMNGNLYRTLDSGVNWKYITTLPLVLDTGYSSLISHDGKLFAGFDSGIAVSTDFGATWKTITVSGASIVPIITDGNRLIAGGQGVYVSSDGGTTWIALLGRPPGDVRTITVLGQRLFASTQWGLFESVDNGTHWNKVDVPLFEYPYLVNAVFADSSNLLVGADQIYLSNDEGTTWTNPVMNVPNGARAVNFYTKIGGLTVAGLQYYSLDYSFDNGITWENDTTIYKQYARAVVADSSRLYLGCQGGVFRRSMVTAQLSVAIAEAPNVEVSVYPNPATGVLTISNVPENLESISILNVLGVQMMEISKQSAREFQIDISKLPEGVYYAKFAIGGSTFTRKILKQR